MCGLELLELLLDTLELSGPDLGLQLNSEQTNLSIVFLVLFLGFEPIIEAEVGETSRGLRMKQNKTNPTIESDQRV